MQIDSSNLYKEADKITDELMKSSVTHDPKTTQLDDDILI